MEIEKCASGCASRGRYVVAAHPASVRSRTRRGNTLRSGDPLTATGSEASFIKAGLIWSRRGVRTASVWLGLRRRRGAGVALSGHFVTCAEISCPRATFFPLGGNKVERGAANAAHATLFRPPRQCSRPPRPCYPSHGPGNNVPRAARRELPGTKLPPSGQFVPGAGLRLARGTNFPPRPGAVWQSVRR